MLDLNAPKDGDFAAYLNGVANQNSSVAQESSARASGTLPQGGDPEPQTIQQVLLEGQEPTDEFLEQFIALNEAPELSDEELERQALSAPGDDGDVSTPE
jgi:hypothetical protein